MRTFELITDPGHGWLKVAIATVYDIGLHPQDFSAYSYKSGVFMYLEEDCDMHKFLSQYQQAEGDYRIAEVHLGDYCYVRDLPHNEPAPVHDTIPF